VSLDPVISIVLPTYNGARYLGEAVRSCLAQTYRNWELIVVDDCSTDATPGLIAQYAQADMRIRAVRHAINRKLPAALNSGFGVACGEFLTWTSDDNAFKPEALETMLEALRTHRDVDIVYTDFTELQPSGAQRLIRVGQPDELAHRNCVMASFMYRRRVHQTLGGYDESLFLAEDYDFWLRASVHFKLMPLHRDVYLYRCHERSLTATKAAQVRAAAERALARALPQMRWLAPPRKAAGYMRLACLADARSDARTAGRCLWRAFRYDPMTTMRRAPRRLFAQAILGRWAAGRLAAAAASLRKVSL
jgi:glycosyltransferase involved in cell wall biosynthesis